MKAYLLTQDRRTNAKGQIEKKFQTAEQAEQWLVSQIMKPDANIKRWALVIPDEMSYHAYHKGIWTELYKANPWGQEKVVVHASIHWTGKYVSVENVSRYKAETTWRKM